MRQPEFRVIVVGGGPVGLTAAHILSHAGIDFIVLEKHNTVTPELGNVTGLWPQTMRILDQLSLLEPLSHLQTPLGPKVVLTHQGHVFSKNESFCTRNSHGYDIELFHRQDLLKALYDNLPESIKTKIHVNKLVTSVEICDNTSVRVTCADGTVEEGNMVIGADGVHSTTRQLAQQLNVAVDFTTSNKESPYLATYRVLYGSVPIPAGAAVSHAYESHGQGASVQLFIGKDRAWFLVYSPLPSGPTKARVRYSQQDADDYAATYGDIHVTDKVSFGEIYATKFASALTNLEEGIVRQWSFGGRIVLVGDAAHKVTPNTGWGYNSSVHDLVALVNRLRPLASRDTSLGDSKQEVSTDELKRVFKDYQTERMDHMQRIHTIAGKYTRLMCWRTGWKKLLSRYIFPRVGADNFLVTYALGAQIRLVSVLDWIDEPHYAEGQIPWDCPVLGKKKSGAGPWPLIHAAMPAIVAVL